MGTWSISDMTLTREWIYRARRSRWCWVLRCDNVPLITTDSRADMELKMACLISELLKDSEDKK